MPFHPAADRDVHQSLSPAVACRCYAGKLVTWTKTRLRLALEMAARPPRDLYLLGHDHRHDPPPSQQPPELSSRLLVTALHPGRDRAAARPRRVHVMASLPRAATGAGSALGQVPLLVGVAGAVPDLELGTGRGRPVRIVETLA